MYTVWEGTPLGLEVSWPKNSGPAFGGLMEETIQLCTLRDQYISGSIASLASTCIEVLLESSPDCLGPFCYRFCQH